jgi:hypothetical protein
MNFSLGREKIKRLRQELLFNASGEVLEIGFATGLNVSCYPNFIHTITAIDVSQFEPCYIYPRSQIHQLIMSNEDFVKTFSPTVHHWFGKTMYLGGFRRKAVEAETRGKTGQLHQFDWRIEYFDIDRNTFAIHIYECGMDSLFAHYFHQSFKRSGTLADGNPYCDC